MQQDTEEVDLVDLPSAIAIIGLACRFPGARNLEAFRRNLENGVESITTFSDQELLQAGVAPELLVNPDYVKAAPLLEDADQFDASFFECSPREAVIMDPQQRLFLECAWEGLEDAGHAGDAYGSSTGVFSGAGGIMSTYLLSDTHFNPQLTGTTASLQHVGNDKDYLSTRVSYKLNLRGPSLTVQTACSTSLVAIHLACQSLLTRECDMALAGGTTVRVPQRTGYLFKEGNVFSRDGHCRAFDADAQGTVFGSGIGVVVLKRLTDALRDGDTIRAVIRGTAINNDGSENKTSYWAPHAEGQADAMRRALSVARVDPSSIGYVEAHGTATIKGDPTEVRALAQAFGSLPRRSCAIGSVKSNIGHPESAAGVAGLIKAVLSLENKVLFPSLNYARPNPEIESADAFFVNATRQPWEARATPRRAAVNSLGIGGTNAFVILEEAPEAQTALPKTDRSSHLLTLSAKSPEALNALTQRFQEHLQAHPDVSLADICFSANVGRAHFPHRIAVVASSTEEAAQLVGAETTAGRRESGHVVDGERPRIAFLFTGQGSQYIQMGQELYETNTTFREVFDRCAATLSSHLDVPLVSVLYRGDADPSLVNETGYTQPALFAIEYALASLWRSWGVEPSVLIGHSVGEIVAACVAGVMSLEDGLRLTAERGRLMQALPRGGGMAAVRCDADRAARALERYRETVSIAALNGPADVVLSGRLEDVQAVVRSLEHEGIAATQLKVSHAFHSHLMDPMLQQFAGVAAGVTFSAPEIPVISNLTGRLATSEILTPDYWVRHVRHSVRFAQGITAADALGIDVFLEVGPSPVLIGMARLSAPKGSRAWLPSLRPGRSDWRQITESLAVLYARGVKIDWTAFDRDYSRRRVHLPTYPFQRQRYWIDAPAATAPSMAQPTASLLGQRMRLPHSAEVRFETRWSAHAPAYLSDHRIFDTVVVPGASHLAMVLSALRGIDHEDDCALEDIVFSNALTLSDDNSRTAQLVFKTENGKPKSFEVISLREGADDTESKSWVSHASGRVNRGDAGTPTAEKISTAPGEWRRRCTKPGDTTFYDRFWEAGYHLRGAFRWIKESWLGDGEILCELRWPELPDDPAEYALYPSLIDACFQAVFSGRASDRLRENAVYVPFSIRRLAFFGTPAPGTPLWCHVSMSSAKPSSPNSVDADITLCEATGRVVVQLDDCQLREVRREALLNDAGQDLRDALYEVEWQVQPRAHGSPASQARESGMWIAFADAGSFAASRMIQQLRDQHERCVQVDAGSEYRQVDTDHYVINATASGDFQRLLRDVTVDAHARCRGVIHFWSLDAQPMNAPSAAASREGVVGSVLYLTHALAGLESRPSPRLWLVTRGAQPAGSSMSELAIEQAPIWGLGRVIALEHQELKCVRIDLDPEGEGLDGELLFQDIWSAEDEYQLAYRGGVRYVSRLTRSSALSDRAHDAGEDMARLEAVQVRLSSYGQIGNLVVRPLMRRPPAAGELEIEVCATGLNFRDVLIALGLLESHYAERLGMTSAEDMTFGFECAGTVVRTGDDVSGFTVGDQVLAVATHDALATYVTVSAAFVAHKPTELTFEEAATLPLAFITAYHGLHALARLQPGERVLIHAAAGGVGQACVQWAQQVGAEVFATASPAKWDHLKANGVRYVMNSRTLDFADQVRELTRGEGVDVVLNTLSGPFVERSFEVLKRGGRFVELGKRDVWSEDQARERRPDVSYLPFDLMEVSKKDPHAITAMIRVMTEGLQAGTVTPLRLTAFPLAKVTEAFKFMAEARHIGRIAITMPSIARERERTFTIRENASYLITGGSGALGLEIAQCLVDQGARHLVLTSRHAPAGSALATIEALRITGVTVLVVQADVADAAQVTGVLTTVRDSAPPLRGIVHAAGVLDDGVLLQQTWERFQRVMAPKVEGTWNLHALTQGLPLDFFVCFSSVASLLGNAGQGNYAAANAFMDAIAHYRHARGLPALSINWGPWGEAGMAAGAEGPRQRRLADQGFRFIASTQGIEVFTGLLRTDSRQVGVLPVNWQEYLRVNSSDAPFFSKVATRRNAPPQAPDLRKQLADAPDPRALLAQHVRSVVANVLGMRDGALIDARARLFDLGLESLMAVEMRGRFEESLGCPLRATLLFDYPTIEALVEHLAGKLAETAISTAARSTARPVVSTSDALAAELEALDEDQLAERLAQELMGNVRVHEQ